MAFITWISDAVFKIEKVAAILLTSTMLVSLSAGVFYRYVLSSPLTWSDEVAIFSLVWLTFIGGSMGIKQQSSAAVTIFMDRFKGTLRTILMGISLLAVLIFVIYILYLSFVWLSSPNILLQRSSSMRLPMIIPYLSIPVSFTFLAVHSLDLLLKNFSGKKEAI